MGLQGALLRLEAYKADNGNVALVSNLVGLGGLETAFLDKGAEETGFIPFFRALLVGLFETLPGLMLQPSLFALTFEHTDETSRKKQLLSLVITWGTTLNMTMGTLPVLKNVVRTVREGEFWACIDIIPAVIFTVGAFVAMIVGMMRVYHAYTCDAHLWNLFSGCVVF